MSNVSPLMYTVDDRDAPLERKDVPQSSIGAPCPMLLVSESVLNLAYYLEERDAGWDGTSVRVVGQETQGEPCALVRFRHSIAHMFGPPNDEAFAGHPLAERGLEPYAVFEVENSSWLRTLERMNSVHPYHRAERYAIYKHFIFAFHDSVFECIAEGFELSVYRDSVSNVLRSSWREG
jgi:hypothetical protein